MANVHPQHQRRFSRLSPSRLRATDRRCVHDRPARRGGSRTCDHDTHNGDTGIGKPSDTSRGPLHEGTTTTPDGVRPTVVGEPATHQPGEGIAATAEPAAVLRMPPAILPDRLIIKADTFDVADLARLTRDHFLACYGCAAGKSTTTTGTRPPTGTMIRPARIPRAGRPAPKEPVADASVRNPSDPPAGDAGPGYPSLDRPAGLQRASTR
jgi:hypothetical protein